MKQQQEQHFKSKAILMICRTLLLLGLFSTKGFAITPIETLGQAMDANADPCVDFYRYACGGWLDNTQLAEDQLQYTRGFDLAKDEVEQRLYVLFEEAASLYPSGNADQDRVGAFYQSCKTAGSDSPQDLSGLDAYLTLIDSITNHSHFLQVAGHLHKISVNRLFNIDVIPNFIDAQHYTLSVSAGDPSFADGDIYTRMDPASKALRKVGLRYINDTLLELGENTALAQRHSKQIFAIERVLSKHHDTYGKSTGLAYPNDPYLMRYMYSKIPWESFFLGLAVPANQGFFVSPAFVRDLGKVLFKMPLDTLKAYLKWSLISEYSAYLPDKYYRNIHSEVIFSLVRPSITKFCVHQTSRELGDAVAKLMAGNENPAPVSALSNSIMSNIKQQFKQNLPEIVWLDEDALSATQIKLDALTEQYSYPQVWPNFSGLIMDPQDLLANVITARSNHFQRKIQQYGATVDRNSWEFLSNPQTVNAFYFSLKNQIHLLAGLLRAPFLDLDSPAVLNYAAVGMVAAHELMHGFNQHGRYFQADGHFQPLWSKKVNRNFSKLSHCVRNQYSRFPVAPGLKINGKTTLEENLADMGGLKLAYQAFQNVSGEPETFVVNNQTLTANQLFFIRYAQNYCSASREGVEKYLSSRSWWRYSPDRYRVIGPIINRPEFSQAFDCPRGAVMNPIKKCSVW